MNTRKEKCRVTRSMLQVTGCMFQVAVNRQLNMDRYPVTCNL